MFASNFCSRHSAWLMLGFTLIAVGCSPDEPNLKPVFPVKGSLFVDGQPASGAIVRFHPLPIASEKSPGLVSRGKVGPEGTFQLTTYNTDDGAPEGEYAVAVFWPGKRTGKNKDDEDSSDLPPDRLGMRFNNPANSKIKVQVAAPGTQLERFDLR